MSLNDLYVYITGIVRIILLNENPSIIINGDAMALKEETKDLSNTERKAYFLDCATAAKVSSLMASRFRTYRSKHPRKL